MHFSLPLNAVHDEISESFQDTVEKLKKLVSFPGVSAQGLRSEPLRKTADWLEQMLYEYGLSEVQRLSVPQSAPYVFAQIRSPNARAKTVLFYAHYDVQPVGDEKIWQSPPFQAEARENRLYGRGTADDKAGIIAVLACIRGFLKSSQPLPVHIKIILDGEEEVGSPNIEAFLNKHADLLRADYLIVPDLVNPDSQTPSLIFSLRGLVNFRVKLSSMTKGIHSGLAGGVVPDPTQSLAKLYADAIGKKVKC